MALVWTGNDYGVLKCHLDPTYPDCSIVCAGGIKEKTVRAALDKLLKKKEESSFKGFPADFETAVHKMMKSRAWADEWTYPPMEDDDDEERLDAYYQDENILESHAFDKQDVGPWCFGK